MYTHAVIRPAGAVSVVDGALTARIGLKRHDRPHTYHIRSVLTVAFLHRRNTCFFECFVLSSNKRIYTSPPLKSKITIRQISEFWCWGGSPVEILEPFSRESSNGRVRILSHSGDDQRMYAPQGVVFVLQSGGRTQTSPWWGRTRFDFSIARTLTSDFPVLSGSLDQGELPKSLAPLMPQHSN